MRFAASAGGYRSLPISFGGLCCVVLQRTTHRALVQGGRRWSITPHPMHDPKSPFGTDYMREIKIKIKTKTEIKRRVGKIISGGIGKQKN